MKRFLQILLVLFLSLAASTPWAKAQLPAVEKDPIISSAFSLAGSETVMDLQIGWGHACVLTGSGGVQCWGWNDYGQLGNGTTSASNVPVNVIGLSSGVQSIYVGEQSTCALLNTGTVECWGKNDNGQLGNNSTTDSSVPVIASVIGGGVKSLGVGESHTCALMNSGSVKCWGNGGNGQLGNGASRMASLTPVDVIGLSNIKALATGDAHNCVITESGGVKCWGFNPSGGLGDGTFTERAAPVDVVGLPGPVREIAAGREHTCAILNSGAVYCWGGNYWGMLGNGSTTQTGPDYGIPTPVQVSGLSSGVVHMDATREGNCAVMSNKKVKCWGWWNINYPPIQSMQSLTPLTFTNLTDPIAQVTIGSFYGCAKTEKNEILCWGGNNYGQLGNGMNTESSIPDYVVGFGLDVTRFEVNQALGQDLFAGPANIQLAARKPAAIRAFLNHPIKVEPYRQYLQIIRDGAFVTTLYPQPSPSKTQTLTFLCPTLGQCGGWVSGNYTFNLFINGMTITKSAVFQNKRTLRILAVPVRVKSNGVVIHPDNSWQTADEFLRKTYPVAYNGVSWIQDSELDATDLTLTNSSDQRTLWERLKDKQPFWCNWYGSCYDSIVGFLPEISICSTKGCVKGWTYGSPATIVMTREDVQAIVAHEIGHTYGLGDEYNCGWFACNINPPPDWYYGEQGNATCSNQFRCVASVAVAWKGGSSGSSVLGPFPNTVFPFEVGGRGALGDKLSFMGGAGEGQANYWVSTDVYTHLFETLPSASGPMQRALAADEPVVQASGWIGSDDSLTMEAWHTGSGAAPSPSTGEYAIDALDGAGNVLATQEFNLSFLALSDPPVDLDRAYFDLTVPMPGGTKSFQIRHSTSVLKTVAVSDHAPEVTVISPNGGETWTAGQEETVAWSGSDLDNDPLRYTVEYSPDGVNWRVLASNLEGTSLQVNPAGLPGGNNARIRVFASDGLYSAQDESDGAFRLPDNPPTAYILNPANFSWLTPGVPVALTGSAFDAEDLSFDESQFQWSSNVDGSLGTGSQILASLTPGEHTITLTVTDSQGNRSTTSITIRNNSPLFIPVVFR